MSVQVRPGYINPLTTMTSTKLGHSFLEKNRTTDKTTDLQTKQQQLQNALLLLKSTGTDSGVSTAEQQEKLQAQLEKVSKELQSAKNDIPQEAALSPSEKVQENHTAFSHTRLQMDTYEKSTKEVRSPGIYQLKREKISGYHISFTPYSE